MKTKSDWKKEEIIKLFELNTFSIKKEDSLIFGKEEIIDFPFLKYKISNEEGEVYLVLVQFENISDAISNATRISNQFRSLKDKYVSSGVNGDILALVISSADKKIINTRVFDVLKDM